MRASPRLLQKLVFFKKLRTSSGGNFNPVPPAYNTGPWQGNTTIARKKYAQVPETPSLPGGSGCVKAGTGTRQLAISDQSDASASNIEHQAEIYPPNAQPKGVH
jgi:hypothetical protein